MKPAPVRFFLSCAPIWLVLLTTGLTGCSTFEPDGARMTATAVDRTMTTEDPAAVEVTVENPGVSPVTWGRGSGSCRLFLLVRVDGTDYLGSSFNGDGCTLDDRIYWLDPGETYTRTVSWEGWVSRNDSTVHLGAGTYEVRGRAYGSSLTSNPVAMTVE